MFGEGLGCPVCQVDADLFGDHQVLDVEGTVTEFSVIILFGMQCFQQPSQLPYG